MKQLSIVALLLACCLVAMTACQERESFAVHDVEPLQVSGERAYDLLEDFIEISPRHSGSKGAAEAVDFIVAQAEAIGYEPTVDTWTEETAHGPVTFRNVCAELPGKASGFIIVGSHYDTKKLPGIPDFTGANDSGSSTALLLEIMRVTREAGPWPAATVRFAFFDGEESVTSYTHNDGLHGSKRMAQQLRRDREIETCRAMILIDMIGDKDLTITLPTNSDAFLIRRLLEIAEEQGSRDAFGFHLNGIIIDDHVPFRELGIPVINVIDFQYGPNNSYWHTDRDTIEHVSAESMATVGDAVVRLMQDFQ